MRANLNIRIIGQESAKNDKYSYKNRIAKMWLKLVLIIENICNS